MYLFYIIALIPLFVGMGFYLFSVKFSWIEWLIVSVASFALAGIFHAGSIYSMTGDYETWSGQIVSAKHFARWEESYQEAIYRTEYYYTTESYTSTDSHGRSHTHHERVQHSKQVFDHWEDETRWHDDSYQWWSNIDTSYGIDAGMYADISKKFNDNHPYPGNRVTNEHNSHMIAGDPNDYESDNKTGWIQPVTKLVSFENRVRYAPSVFNFVMPSPDQQKSLFQYPQNGNPYVSDRVLGDAKNHIDTFAWDQLNARLGSSKKVNLIIIGFNTPDSMQAQRQESLYYRGKKNDLVLCYGTGWTRVFGWTENAVVERKLENILLEHTLDDSIIPLIEAEVKADYVIKPWKKFDYLTIDPPAKFYLYYFLTLILVEAGIFYWSLTNDLDKEGEEREISDTMDSAVGISSKNSRRKRDLTSDY